MFLSFRFAVFLFIFLILINKSRSNKEFEIKCIYSLEGRDQMLINRQKRFVLFPEFRLWYNDWRYLNHPKEFLYWISNYYPQSIDNNIIQFYIHQIINDLNQYIHQKIQLIAQASAADQSNFNYLFFNYQICPTDDPLATKEHVDNVESLLIYPSDLVQNKRYRAHGGITLDDRNNSSRSHMKFNMHHQFLTYQDFQYDPVIYTCTSDESHCRMDLYAFMLHETLHGFGIEHTERNLTNKKILAVMDLYSSRIMCHDDIRAIRKVYGLPVTRKNILYDQTCRRDFPLNKLQKIMKKIHRWIILYGFYLGSIISFTTFIFTLIYILLKRCFLNRINHQIRYSIESDISHNIFKKQNKSAMNAFLWHDEFLNG